MKKENTYLTKAKKIVEEKRKSNIISQKNRAKQREAMLSFITGSFSSMGIDSIKIGSDTINLKEKDDKIEYSKEEEFLVECLNKGNKLYGLSIHNSNCRYSKKEFVEFENQKTEDVVNLDFIKNLAPTAMIFKIEDKKPWEDIFYYSFLILTNNIDEFNLIWENINNWTKKDWHDDIMKIKKVPHKFDNVFSIDYYCDFASDLNWRNMQYKKMLQKTKESSELNSWAYEAQQELKKAISFLIPLESNPLCGEEVESMVDKLTPFLANAMECKESLQKANDDCNKARTHLYNGVVRESIKFSDWTNTSPFKENKNKKKIKP